MKDKIIKVCPKCKIKSTCLQFYTCEHCPFFHTVEKQTCKGCKVNIVKSK